MRLLLSLLTLLLLSSHVAAEQIVSTDELRDPWAKASSQWHYLTYVGDMDSDTTTEQPVTGTGTTIRLEGVQNNSENTANDNTVNAWASAHMPAVTSFHNQQLFLYNI